MAKKKRRKAKRNPKKKVRTKLNEVENKRLAEDFSGGLEGDRNAPAGLITGRVIMTVMETDKADVDNALKAMSGMTGLSASSANVMRSSDVAGASFESSDTSNANYVVLENLGIVIMNGDPDECSVAMAANVQDHNVIVEPEYWNYAQGFESSSNDSVGGPGFEAFEPGMPESDAGPVTASRDFLLGARQMLDLMLQREASETSAINAAQAQCFRDTANATWGLQATGVANSSSSGRGVKVAVLDSGFDIGHPDFAGRTVRRATFIPSSEPDNDANDRSGHGTHCIGTACGPRNPGVGPRYGIAHGAEIFSGKVLRQGTNGRAAGADGWILEGIDWALGHGCEIISMSFGQRVNSSGFPMKYEMAARRGLQAGTLIVAATGNDSHRRTTGHIDPVNQPANCPSILGVSAVDPGIRVARFSNGQRFSNGGEVNLTGPGVNVLSSLPMPRRRGLLDGTSMATPHVAGIAALICEETGLKGINLFRELRTRVRRLGNVRDFGNGLVRV